MSFGVYRPTMGVAGGHRELCSNQTAQEQRRLGEQMRRQENNPITGEPMSVPSRRPPSGSRGSLRSGLVPSSGPLDHVIAPDKDVPSKRVDPTKNISSSFQSGVSCMTYDRPEVSRSQPSRITESCFAEGLCERAPTPERSSSSRRSTPGQVVRTNLRPKDNLSGGCVTSDRPSDHPLNLPRKVGSASQAVASGGSCHILQGPNGFVPVGPEDEDLMSQAPRRASSREPGDRGFRRACGLVAAA
mmetsp:Transcript_54070/g.86014  ORF Transcript_54070/g.86014 Transcript_54070/m.86014 type:complete len:244 (-) Transcript_54070:104-835(-)|eukprot:CAMPEP_0169113174 /NCGR_PEP_ID=MMETSP1015-20121227/28054_1 /TAXON_ID=342587 /ORGANISM="Karlodinium micrum, Strain CCMP2283" /LENGTH=243 /DNA_ID=CAMNT_0009175313 /DNA_START=61 /DNA_END=792 /DNA_ORIENTATION=+